MASLTYNQAKQELFQRIPESIVLSIQKFIVEKDPKLWGEQKPRKFVEHMVVLVLYKDVFKIGYQQVCRRVNLEYNVTHKSLQKNAERLRPLMKQWAKVHVILGSLTDWKQAARNCGLTGDVKSANMWMDSTDIPLEGKKSVSRKDPQWSFKLNSPGQRYMMVRDGKGKILKIWGGYSPKVYDGTWLEIMKDNLEDILNGAVILADSHFSAGKRLFQNITFLTNNVKPKKRKRGEEDEGTGIKVLTNKQKKFNEDHRQARARVESPFGFMKSKIESLKKPWSESLEQMDCLVWTAAAIHNLSLK